MFLRPGGCEDNGGNQCGTLSTAGVALNPKEKTNWQPGPSTSPQDAPKSWKLVGSSWEQGDVPAWTTWGRVQGLAVVRG